MTIISIQFYLLIKAKEILSVLNLKSEVRQFLKQIILLVTNERIKQKFYNNF